MHPSSSSSHGNVNGSLRRGLCGGWPHPSSRFLHLLTLTLLNFAAYSLWTLLNKWQFMPVVAGGLGVTRTLFSTSAQMFVAGAFSNAALQWRRRRHVESVEGRMERGLLPTPTTRSLVLPSTLVHRSGVFFRRIRAHWLWPKLRRILPLGIARSVDIGCANAALVHISVAAQQMVKSTLPLFVALLSWLWLRRRLTAVAWIAMVPIALGTVAAVWKSTGAGDRAAESEGTAMHRQEPMRVATDGGDMATRHVAQLSASWGLALAFLSCAGRAFKAVINGKLLKPAAVTTVPSANSGEEVAPSAERLEPLDILRYEAPLSACMLLLLGCAAELWWSSAIAANHRAVPSSSTMAAPQRPSGRLAGGHAIDAVLGATPAPLDAAYLVVPALAVDNTYFQGKQSRPHVASPAAGPLGHQGRRAAADSPLIEFIEVRRSSSASRVGNSGHPSLDATTTVTGQQSSKSTLSLRLSDGGDDPAAETSPWPLLVGTSVLGGFLMFVNQGTYINIIDASSPVTCQVLMNVKMLLLIVVAVRLFHTPLSGVNVLGVLVATSGCLLYAYGEATSGTKKEKSDDNDDNDAVRLRTSSSSVAPDGAASSSPIAVIIPFSSSSSPLPRHAVDSGGKDVSGQASFV